MSVCVPVHMWAIILRLRRGSNYGEGQHMTNNFHICIHLMLFLDRKKVELFGDLIFLRVNTRNGQICRLCRYLQLLLSKVEVDSMVLPNICLYVCSWSRYRWSIYDDAKLYTRMDWWSNLTDWILVISIYVFPLNLPILILSIIFSFIKHKI